MTPGPELDDPQPLTQQAARLRLLRVITAVAGLVVAAMIAMSELLVSSLAIVAADSVDALATTMNAVGLVMLAASVVVVAGLLAQWLWLGSPGQPGTNLLLVGLLLRWGWDRLMTEVDLWGFSSYAGSLEWSNPDIRPRLLAASILGMSTLIAELVLFVWGSLRMIGGRSTRKQPLSEQPDPLA